MSAEEMRVAIAEACGWTTSNVDIGPRIENLWISPDGLTNGPSNETLYLPNYLNDLNAMHEAEKRLETDEEIENYLHWLTDVSGADVPIGKPSFTAYFATAAQRAEAFLRTIGKWNNQTKGEG